MSQQFVDDFFPHLTSFLRSNYPYLLRYLFPQINAIKCAKPFVTVFLPFIAKSVGYEVAHYSLIKYELAGAVVGLLGTFLLPGKLWLWRLAFFFFSLMNLDAIVVHNLAPHQSTVWILARTLDVAFTACSSTCLILSCFVTSAKYTTKLVVYLLLGTIMKFAFQANHRKIPWANEVLYLGTTEVAVACIAWRVVISKWTELSSRRKKWLGVAISGLCIAMAGLPLDRTFCETFGSEFTHIHLLFAGCNVAFSGFLGFHLSDDAADKRLNARDDAAALMSKRLLSPSSARTRGIGSSYENSHREKRKEL